MNTTNHIPEPDRDLVRSYLATLREKDRAEKKLKALKPSIRRILQDNQRQLRHRGRILRLVPVIARWALPEPLRIRKTQLDAAIETAKENGDATCTHRDDIRTFPVPKR